MYAAITRFEANNADEAFQGLLYDLFRLLKKLQMLSVEERGMRRTLLYAAITRDDDNNADEAFSAA